MAIPFDVAARRARACKTFLEQVHSTAAAEGINPSTLHAIKLKLVAFAKRADLFPLTDFATIPCWSKTMTGTVSISPSVCQARRRRRTTMASGARMPPSPDGNGTSSIGARTMEEKAGARQLSGWVRSSSNRGPAS